MAHECPICQEYCDCDGEDAEMVLLDPEDCKHLCEDDEDDFLWEED